MERTLLAVAVLIGAAFSFVAPAHGQQACAKRADVLKHLADKYQEKSVARGIANNGGALEVLSNPNGSFTIIVTTPSGISCLIATGRAWEELMAPGRES